jgi:hypothetical protein
LRLFIGWPQKAEKTHMRFVIVVPFVANSALVVGRFSTIIFRRGGTPLVYRLLRA